MSTEWEDTSFSTVECISPCHVHRAIWYTAPSAHVTDMTSVGKLLAGIHPFFKNNINHTIELWLINVLYRLLIIILVSLSLNIKFLFPVALYCCLIPWSGIRNISHYYWHIQNYCRIHLLSVDSVGFSLEIKLAANSHLVPSITCMTSCPNMVWWLDIVLT